MPAHVQPSPCRRQIGLTWWSLSFLFGAALAASACGGDSTSSDVVDEVPTVVATTSIWADVVQNIACEGQLEVVTLIPAGGDPHAFEPSLSDRGDMEQAAVVVANGLLLEEGLEDTIEAVERAGTPVFRVADHIDAIEYSAGSGDEHDDDGHGSGDEHDDDGHGSGDEDGDEGHGSGDEHEDEDEGHGSGDEHGHGSGDDPHVWFDPTRVAAMLPALADSLIAHAGLDPQTVLGCLADYQAALAAVDTEISRSVAGLPPEARKLVTSHDALGYFAERYGFDVIGTIIPASSGLAETSPAQLEALAQLVEAEGVSAIFAETQRTTDEADALADRLGNVEVITLTTGTLGNAASGADTYVGLLRTTAERIVAGLA